MKIKSTKELDEYIRAEVNTSVAAELCAIYGEINQLPCQDQEFKAKALSIINEHIED